jgi:cytochrome c oxidase subunit 2
VTGGGEERIRDLDGSTIVAKWWSVLFGVVLAATFLIWVVAPVFHWWLPPNVASFGDEVDYLFYVILWITGFFFVLAEVLLVYAMWKFAHRPGHKADFVEGNHRLEMLWTAVPAGILLFIAFAQIGAWERIKYGTRMPPPDQVVQVTARQWEWRLRYPARQDREGVALAAWARRWAEVPEADDLHAVNELHTWRGANVKIFLKTVDVLHSFGIPNLRLMQDALPGKTIPMWFKAIDSNAHFVKGKVVLNPKKEWEIACKELCGNGHYRMRGLLVVFDTEDEYNQWLKQSLAEQKSRKADEVAAAER